jgi:urease alpha subunit
MQMRGFIVGFAMVIFLFSGLVMSSKAEAVHQESSHIVFDGTITLGNLLTLLGMLIALITSYTRIMSRIGIIETRVHDLWDDYKNRRSRKDND